MAAGAKFVAIKIGKATLIFICNAFLAFDLRDL
jgi:hypothetical protein